MREETLSRKYPLLQPIVLLVLVGLVLGLVFFFTGMTLQLAIVAYIVVGVTIVVAGIDMIKALKSGHWGLDILAIIAMVATLAVEEYLAGLDRKSTRLNSSHVAISYAVFCLERKEGNSRLDL